MMRRLITGNFVHDSFVHLAGSSYALATVCPAIEEILGWDIFLAVYLMSALGGSVATFTLGDALTVGASSGIFGLIGEAQQQCRDIIVMPYCGLQCSFTKIVLHHMNWRQCKKTLSRSYPALGLHELCAEVYTRMPPLSVLSMLGLQSRKAAVLLQVPWWPTCGGTGLCQRLQSS